MQIDQLQSSYNREPYSIRIAPLFHAPFAQLGQPTRRRPEEKTIVEAFAIDLAWSTCAKYAVKSNSI
jgi:hypothetical protein